MRFVLEILIIGLLFHTGYGLPKPTAEDEEQADTPTKGRAIITTPPQKFYAYVGENLTLPCTVEHNENEDGIVWMFGNKNVYVDDYKYSKEHVNLGLDNITHSLIVTNFSPSLEGSYICAIPARNISILHHVYQKVKVSVDSINAKKFVDNLSELSITCRVRGLPDPTITWFKKSSDNMIEQDLRIYSSQLIIPRASFTDSGIYTCKADNGETTDSKSIMVTVINGLAPEAAKVYAGPTKGNTKLCCVFDKERDITWMKDGRMVKPNDRITHENEKHKKCLVIQDAREEDLGTYSCITDGNTGEQAKIELNGAPAKPVSKEITTGEDGKSPFATWTITSLFPISEYKIYSKKAEEYEWKQLEHKKLSDQDRKDEITYHFPNLSNGRYSVKIEVINKYGSNESVDNGSLVVDRVEPNVIMSAKINSGDSGAESQYRISSLCVLFVILMRLWSC